MHMIGAVGAGDSALDAWLDSHELNGGTGLWMLGSHDIASAGDSTEVVFDSVGLQMLDGEELTSALHMITEETRDGTAGGSDAPPPLTEAAIDTGEKLLAEERAENDQLRARLAQLEASRNTPASEAAVQQPTSESRHDGASPALLSPQQALLQAKAQSADMMSSLMSPVAPMPLFSPSSRSRRTGDDSSRDGKKDSLATGKGSLAQCE